MLNVIDKKYHIDSKIFNNIYIVPDIRFFALYALFNGIYDYHDEYAEDMSAARLELIQDVKQAAAGLDEQTLLRWQAYYTSHKTHIWSYIYYTSFCSLPPAFELWRDTVTDIAYKTALDRLKNFNRILAEFYEKCGVEQLYFEKYKSLLLNYIDGYDEEHIHKDIDYVHQYLRIPKPTQSAMNIVIVPIPFESHFMGYGAAQKNKLYLFESVGAQTQGLNIHEYLHSFVNPAVESVGALDATGVAKVFEEQRNKEWILTDYGELRTFIAENFVRAITYRVITQLYGKQNLCFDELSQFGLVLVKHIYAKLKDEYEPYPKHYRDINQFIHDFITTYP